MYEKRLKSIELLRAWSFYLSSSSSLSGAIRPSGHCIPQPLTSTSTSNDLPQPQPQFPTVYWPHHLHHPNAFVPSWYALWFQTCICRSLCIWSSQVQAHVFVRPGGHWSITKEVFVILISYSDFPEDKANIYTRKKSLGASSRAFIHTTTKGCSKVIHFMPRQVGDLQEGQLPELYVPQ